MMISDQRNEILAIRKYLKKKLDPGRYEHTLGVAATCQALAMRYEYDLHKAALAGMLHDCAKRFDNDTMMDKCISREIPISEGEIRDPSLLHAKLGAWYAREKFGIEDDEILNAIACHTTGKPQMTLLDKILYVADYIEPGRFKAPELPVVRKMAFVDLDLACLTIMENILAYLESTNCIIDPMTERACEDMRNVVSARETAVTLEETSNPETPTKEVTKHEPVKRNGKNRRTRTRREKRRRY